MKPASRRPSNVSAPGQSHGAGGNGPANPPAGRATKILHSSWFLACLLIAVTVLAYLPARNAGFIWDDDDYVTNNPLLTAPDGLRRIWFSLDSPSQYFPMTYTVFRMERAFWGVNPAGYHWVNLLLHVANALFLWRLLKALRVPGNWLAAAIFALHPVQVESVAWISELKNVLSLFFYLLALLAWVKFTAKESKATWRFYVLALFFYLLALFSKSTICTFPLVLLLILWLQKRAISWTKLAQTVPFWVLSVAMGLLTIWWERFHQGTQGTHFSMGFIERILIASHAFWFYAGKLVWPAHLTFSYPRWVVNASDVFAYGGLVAGLGLGVCICFLRRLAGRSVEVAVVFFAVTLSPLLGFIMLYTFRYSFVADHYQYIACIGPIALTAAGIWRGLAFGEQTIPWLKPVLCGFLLLTLGALTCRQCGTYKDAETLWRATLAENPSSFLAYNNLGNILFQKGRLDEAKADYEKALSANPDDAEAWNNLGNLALKQGRLDESVADYRKALDLNPEYAVVHYNLGYALFQSGRKDEAMKEYETATKVDPNNAEVDCNYGSVLFQTGRLDEAIRYYEKALKANPDFAAAQEGLANVLLQKGRLDEAIGHFQKALESNPDDAGIRYNLGNLFLQRGHVDEAIAQYQKALEASPNDAGIHCNLATAYFMAGRFAEAIDHFQKGLAIKPDDVGARYNLGLALLRAGRRSEAIAQFNEVLRLKPDYEAAKAQLRALGSP